MFIFSKYPAAVNPLKPSFAPMLEAGRGVTVTAHFADLEVSALLVTVMTAAPSETAVTVPAVTVATPSLEELQVTALLSPLTVTFSLTVVPTTIVTLVLSSFTPSDDSSEGQESHKNGITKNNKNNFFMFVSLKKNAPFGKPKGASLPVLL
jgi:hypothetical protein